MLGEYKISPFYVSVLLVVMSCSLEVDEGVSEEPVLTA